MTVPKEEFKIPEFNLTAYHLWLEERAKAETADKRSHFVTISREYGCDGFAVALKLCEMFNRRHDSKWIVFSHQMIEKLAEDEQLGASLIHNVSEKRYSFINWFIDGLVPDYLQSVQSQVFVRMRTLILNLAEKGNCIIIGGGSQIITGDLDPTKFSGIHARLFGHHSFRLKSVMDKFHLNMEKAEQHLKENQDARNKFVEDFTGKSPADPFHYHLLLNNEKNDADIMGGTIFAQAERRGFLK